MYLRNYYIPVILFLFLFIVITAINYSRFTINKNRAFTNDPKPLKKSTILLDMYCELKYKGIENIQGEQSHDKEKQETIRTA